MRTEHAVSTQYYLARAGRDVVASRPQYALLSKQAQELDLAMTCCVQ